MKWGRYSDGVEGEQRSVRDAYGVALSVLLVSTLALIAAGTPVRSPIAAFAALLQVIALVLTLRVSGVRKHLRTFLILAALALFSAAAFVGFMGGEVGELTVQITWLFLTAATIFAIARRLTKYTAVTLQMVLGLLCIYLLLGVSFGLLYLVIDTLNPGSFSEMNLGASGAIYYSFITLATVGYGDISPVGDLARACAVAEAILGQLYLVSIVSLAVSRLGLHPARESRTEETS